jgi:hypothetical protein
MLALFFRLAFFQHPSLGVVVPGDIGIVDDAQNELTTQDGTIIIL